MTKEWVEKKKAEYETKLLEMENQIRRTIMSFPLMSEDEKKKCLENVKDEVFIAGLQTKIDINSCMEEDAEKQKTWKELSNLHLNTYGTMLRHPGFYNGERYLDSEPVHFRGDVIITDPCYIERDDDLDRSRKDELFHPYMERDTIYGDWACTTYDENTGEILGRFCADSGMVGVFLLNDILAYNPEYNAHIDLPHSATCIRNFDGTVQFVIEEYEYEYKNEKHKDYEVHVVGHGIDMKSGKKIDFVTRQTGV